MSTTIRLLLALLAVALTATACGSDDDVADSSPADDAAAASAEDTADDRTDGADLDYPITIESPAGVFTLESQPQRIVSLNPAATEILFAIGAGDQVVAVDEFSYYPPEAPVTDLSGFDPNVEAVIGYDPDLVVLANDANDLVASLTDLGVPVLISSAPMDIEGGYVAFTDLGIAVGRIDETAEVIATMRSEIEEALASAPSSTIRIYHEIDDTFFSASSNGFVGAVYAEMGTTNIADDADTDGFGFPQLTEEYIVEADPQLIVISDQAGYTPDDVAARPGWDRISAVQSGNIVTVDADIASRWGPRLPQFIAEVANALNSVSVDA
jgi:iron complex transport system substrate-binding protein